MSEIRVEKPNKVNIESSTQFSVASIFLIVFFVMTAVVALLPFYAMFLASFKPATELFRYGLNLRLDFNIMNLKNYILLATDDSIPYFMWYKNSLIITVLGTVLSLFFSSMVGYSLAMYEFKGKNLIFVLVLFIMMVPVEILILPLYKLTVAFHIINTYWGIILPFVVSVSGVFFFRQYASGLSKEFMDSARIDGCSEYGIYARIMVPLMKPAFGAMMILAALGNWNSFLWPLIVMRTDDMFTLPVGLMALLTPYGNNYSAVLSGSVLSVLPILILFIINQDSFISGLTAGGVKG